jgi:hypothetical protein
MIILRQSLIVDPLLLFDCCCHGRLDEHVENKCREFEKAPNKSIPGTNVRYDTLTPQLNQSLDKSFPPKSILTTAVITMVALDRSIILFIATGRPKSVGCDYSQ